MLPCPALFRPKMIHLQRNGRIFTQRTHRPGTFLGRAVGRGAATACPRHRNLPCAPPRAGRLRHCGHADGFLPPGVELAGKRLYLGHRHKEEHHARRLQRRFLVLRRREHTFVHCPFPCRARHCGVQPHARAHAAGTCVVPGIRNIEFQRGTVGLHVPQPHGKTAHDCLIRGRLRGRCRRHSPRVFGLRLLGAHSAGPHVQGRCNSGLLGHVALEAASALRHEARERNVLIQQQDSRNQHTHHVEQPVPPRADGTLLPAPRSGALLAGKQMEHHGLLAHHHDTVVGSAAGAGRG